MGAKGFIANNRAGGSQNGCNTPAALAGNLALLASDGEYQRLDPGAGNRDVALPALAGSTRLRFFVVNVGVANNLVVKDPAANVIATILPGEWAGVVCDGAAWRLVAQGAAASNDFGAAGIKTDAIAESTAGAGTTIGAAAAAKVGFHGAAPIAQTSGATQAAPAAYVSGAFGLDSDANMHALYDLVVAMRTTLVNHGLMKGGA